jgi:hypothetical protein
MEGWEKKIESEVGGKCTDSTSIIINNGKIKDYLPVILKELEVYFIFSIFLKSRY